MIRGVKVGTVTGISFDPAVSDNVVPVSYTHLHAAGNIIPRSAVWKAYRGRQDKGCEK